jgi:hypothetical protein
MFIVVMVLFLLPWSLLWAAWKRRPRHALDAQILAWRANCGQAALITAAASTFLELLFFFLVSQRR